ncbi:MAG: late competence development ComFB family protein [Treponema sp.]|jgi:competence protein ComFB|nr:late competence development ComFB family protein [Treponema sp.]
MNIHNTAEEKIIAKVTEIFEAIAAGGNAEGICTCDQCRLDTVCYVLNRTPPRYIVSNRGAARTETDPLVRQQEGADIVTLAHEGIKQISHNQRPHFSHRGAAGKAVQEEAQPVFNIPTIVGRMFNGLDFSPMSGIQVELRRGGELVVMKDYNWQNPCVLVPNTEGAFSFWPVPIPAQSGNLHENFEFTIKAEAPGFEDLNHFFQIPVISDSQFSNTFSMSRIVKLPDLYMFPPGGEDFQGV